MTNQVLITKFYEAFAEGNSKAMTACYHKEVVFQDPAFGTLKGKRANAMWEMLMSRKTADFKFSFDNAQYLRLHSLVYYFLLQF